MDRVDVSLQIHAMVLWKLLVIDHILHASHDILFQCT